jgi:hypothetical protein
VGVELSNRIFPHVFNIQYEIGKYNGIFNGILLVPHNIFMNLNNVEDVVEGGTCC